jgi:glutaredoxin
MENEILFRLLGQRQITLEEVLRCSHCSFAPKLLKMKKTESHTATFADETF